MEFLHQLVIVDFMARLGISVEKFGWVLSWRFGVKFKSLQTWTVVRSNVWPEETTTGSDMKSPEIGQRNSFGGFFCSCLESEEDERWNEILHLRFPLLPPPPISRTRRLGWSFSFSFFFFLFLGFGFGVVQ